MNDRQKQTLWRDLGQIFIWPWWDFERAFEELMKVLEKNGFRQTDPNQTDTRRY